MPGGKQVLDGFYDFQILRPVDVSRDLRELAARHQQHAEQLGLKLQSLGTDEGPSERTWIN